MLATSWPCASSNVRPSWPNSTNMGPLWRKTCHVQKSHPHKQEQRKGSGGGQGGGSKLAALFRQVSGPTPSDPPPALRESFKVRCGPPIGSRQTWKKSQISTNVTRKSQCPWRFRAILKGGPTNVPETLFEIWRFWLCSAMFVRSPKDKAKHGGVSRPTFGVARPRDPPDPPQETELGKNREFAVCKGTLCC